MSHWGISCKSTTETCDTYVSDEKNGIGKPPQKVKLTTNAEVLFCFETRAHRMLEKTLHA